jgi:hypothetical protein
MAVGTTFLSAVQFITTNRRSLLRESGDGHRVAHCHRDSLYRGGGYYVQEVAE